MSLKSRYRNPATSTSESHRSVMCSYIIPNSREQSVVPFAQLRESCQTSGVAWRVPREGVGGHDPWLHTKGSKIITIFFSIYKKIISNRVHSVTHSHNSTVKYNKIENLL